MMFNRGDIIHLEWDPASGSEMIGRHFGLVVSPNELQRAVRLHWVCPISGGAVMHARSAGYLVSLMGSGCRTDGNIHVHQMRALDLRSRKASFVERIPEDILQEVLDLLSGLFE